MNVEEINRLLSDANALFVQKKLTEALSKSKAAFALSKEQNYSEGKFQSNILIGKIHCTQGRYIGDEEYFAQAEKYLQLAENESIANGKKVYLYLVKGDVARHTQQLEIAKSHYLEALEISNGQRDAVGIARALAGQSELFILKNQFAEAMELAQMSLKYLEGLTDDLLKAEVYILLCKIKIKRQEYTEVLEDSEEVLKISRAYGDVEKELIALNNLAVFYGFKLDFRTAIDYLFTSLGKSEAIRYDRQTAQCLVNLGTIYAQLFNYEEALHRYQVVLEKYSRVLEDTHKTILFNNIGTIHLSKNEKSVEQARIYFEKTLELAQQINYQEMIALGLAQISKTAIEKQAFDEALDYANRANKCLENIVVDVEAKAVNLINFGRIRHHLGKFEEATEHLKKGIEVTKNIRNELYEIECYRLLYRFFKENKNFAEAIKYQDLYVEQQADFLKKQRNRQILDHEIKFATKEKQQQIDALKKENELQGLLLEKQEEIQLKNEQLTQANNELQQFARVTSHDLKEPLRMIGSYTQLIHRKFADQVDEDSQIFFDYVREGVGRMKNLLEDLLKYSTVGSGEQPLKSVHLQDVIDICKFNLSLLIEETKTNIECRNLIQVMGIQSLLTQFFQNLFTNAIKFRKPDVAPHIIIEVQEQAQDILVSVKDNGIGIDPEYKDRIFVIFQRLHARQDYEGTGIGLAICFKIIKRLGGKIWVESQLGEGATFFFTLPKVNDRMIE